MNTNQQREIVYAPGTPKRSWYNGAHVCCEAVCIKDRMSRIIVINRLALAERRNSVSGMWIHFTVDTESVNVNVIAKAGCCREPFRMKQVDLRHLLLVLILALQRGRCCRWVKQVRSPC